MRGVGLVALICWPIPVWDFEMLMSGHPGLRLIRGMGRGVPPTGTSTIGATTTSTVLPARGAAYQATPANRPGNGLTRTLPARLPSAGTSTTTTASAAQGSAPAGSLGPGTQLYGGPVPQPVTPSCPAGSTYNPATGNCDSTSTNYLPWIIGGAAVLLIILIAARRR